jgi:hypothetical protein
VTGSAEMGSFAGNITQSTVNVAAGMTDVLVAEYIDKGYTDENGMFNICIFRLYANQTGVFHEFDPNEKAKSRIMKKAVALTAQESVNVATNSVITFAGETPLAGKLVCLFPLLLFVSHRFISLP